MEKIVVLLIDMQEVFLKNINKEETKRVIGNQLEVLDICRERGISIVVLEYGDSGKETISVLRRYLKGMKAKLIKKDDQDGFTNPKLLNLLRGWDVKHIIPMGALADYCVKNTAESAVDNGFEIIASCDLMLSWSNFSRCRRWFEDHGGFEKMACVKSLLTNV